MRSQRWLESDVVWGGTLCSARCGQIAEAMVNGRPICIACADDVLDHLAAIAAAPELRELFGELYDWTTDRRPGW